MSHSTDSTTPPPAAIPPAVETIEAIDGIEQMESPLEGSRPFTRVYYRDGANDLIAAAKALPVRGNHFIAPVNGWPKRIYRRPEATR